MSTVEQGRENFRRASTPANQRPIDLAEARRSKVAQGRALFRASQGNRTARQLTEQLRAGSDPDGPAAA